jgi:hypothetical protein
MTLRAWSVGALVALGIVIAGCGGSQPDRFSLTTPKPPAGTAPRWAAVTDAEKRVIRGWSEEIRHGRVKAAARYFSVPSQSVGMPPGGADLASAREVEEFNDAFPCGAKLLRVARTAHSLVIADFELTSRPGADCGASTGTRATFAFRIDADDHIAQFILVGGPGGSTPGPDTTLASA